MHKLRFYPGTDARDHTVHCKCGWGFSGTYLAVRERGSGHLTALEGEDYRWNDARRILSMPMKFGDR